MKKILMAIIVILISLILAMMLFVVGFNSARRGEKEPAAEPERYRTETVERKENDDAVDPQKHKDAPTEDNAGIVMDEEETPSEDTDVWYRVRLSKNDAASQIGAFKAIENAKALADKNKDKGYRVYDDKGLVYAP